MKKLIDRIKELDAETGNPIALEWILVATFLVLLFVGFVLCSEGPQ